MSEISAQDEQWMRLALAQAERAAAQGEVPVGAILVKEGELLAEACNSPISEHDATAHAEIMALRQASQNEQNYRLPGTTLYVTIEPCTMCVGAMIHARIQRLVFGAKEPRAGAVVSQNNLLNDDSYNHKIAFTEGVLAEECGDLLRHFFKLRRQEAL